MGSLQVTESMDFTAGINTITAPHLIAPSEAVALVNVDIKYGSLRSMPNLLEIVPLQGEFFVEFNNQVLSYTNWRSNARLDNNLYWSDGIDTGKVLDDGRELALGIPAPTTPATLAAVGVAGDGTHTGDFKYTYTFYSTDTGVESAPAPLPPYVVVDQQDITVDTLDPLPEQADRYRIYRIGGYLPRFTLVDTIGATDLPYTDSIDDTQIDGRLLQTMRCDAPPAGIHYFTEMNGRLFGAVGTKLYYSALGNADAWYSSDYFTFPTTIKAVASAPAGLLVMGKNYTYLLSGTMPQNFRLKVISEQLGCISAQSVGYVKQRAIWLSENSLVMSDGYQVTDLTSDKIDNIENLKPTSACVVNEVYYMHYKPSLYPNDELFPKDTLLPATPQGTTGLDTGIIAVDFKRGNKYSYKLISYENIVSIGIADGEVHAVSSAHNTVFLPCDLPLDCSSFLLCSQYSLSKMNTYGIHGLTQLSYVSPQFVDGTYSTLKEYDKVRFNFRGDFVIKIRFADGEVAMLDRITSKPTGYGTLGGILYDEDGLAIVGIPNRNNQSYSIGFDIVGVGTIKSIQYSWKPRELP